MILGDHKRTRGDGYRIGGGDLFLVVKPWAVGFLVPLNRHTYGRPGFA